MWPWCVRMVRHVPSNLPFWCRDGEACVWVLVKHYVCWSEYYLPVCQSVLCVGLNTICQCGHRFPFTKGVDSLAPTFWRCHIWQLISCLHVCLFVCMFVCLFVFCLLDCLLVSFFVYWFVCLFVCLFACLCPWLHICCLTATKTLRWFLALLSATGVAKTSHCWRSLATPLSFQLCCFGTHAHYTLCPIQCIIYIVYYTLYNIHCILYTV